MTEKIKALRASTPPQRQRGAVLIVALLFLVILTMLGLTAMSGTTMEERMSGNTRDINIALQAAEAALRDARRDINRRPLVGVARDTAQSVFGDVSGALGTCSSVEKSKGLCRPPAYDSETFVMPSSLNIGTVLSTTYGQFTGAAKIRATVGGTRNAELSLQPRYIVEVFCLRIPGQDSVDNLVDPCRFYRITAQGFGVNPNSQVTLQEFFEGEI
jgi:type IV pilus assembly protein PilX